MKKIVFVLVSFLLPLGVFASSVSIGNVSVSGNSFSANGSASFTGPDSLAVLLDNVGLISGSLATSWSVSGTANSGRHTLTANVGSASASADFTVQVGGGLSPCQIDETCPNFGLFAPQIPAQGLGSVVTWHYALPGTEGCPVFFTDRCLIK